MESCLAAHAARCRLADVPARAVAAARRSLIDTLGAMVAACAAPGIGAMRTLAAQWGGAPEARVIGGGRCPAPLAAWCHGAMARALELDDCTDYLPLHPSAATLPALLAMADARPGITGADLLGALAVGQDVKIRFGLAVRRHAMQSGRNNPFKIYAAVAGVANLLHLPQPVVQSALGLASSYAVGDGQCAIDGSMGLRVQYGNVGQGAVQATLLAAAGVTGPQRFLTGRYGYLVAFEPEHDLGTLTEGLGERFHGESISVKPYAACRATHPAIDLALAARGRLGGEVFDDVQHVELRVNPEVDGLVGQPLGDKQRPRTGPAAQFSLPFTVATALLRGGFGLADSQPPALADARTLELAGRVVVHADPGLRTSSVLGRTCMTVRLRGGRVFEFEAQAPTGSPRSDDAPLRDDEHLYRKFQDCLSFSELGLQPACVDRLFERVRRLESLPCAASLLDDFA